MSTPDTPTFWKRCSSCRKPIAFEATYHVCTVSTCTRPRTALAFCTVECWDAHVPMLRHRDAASEEARAPSAAAWARQQREAAAKEAAKAKRGR
jgi:hypothetical protein